MVLAGMRYGSICCGAAAALVFLSFGFAAAEPVIVECRLGEGPTAGDVVLILPEGRPASARDTVQFSAVPGTGAERGAVAVLVTTRESPLAGGHARIAFHLDDKTGYVVELARNGDARAFPFDLANRRARPGETKFGGCTPAVSVFAMWR